MTEFDWHSAEISRATPITKSYRNTQKVRRFFKAECGADFTFNRPFMAWLKGAIGQTMGDAVDEWLRRKIANRLAIAETQITSATRDSR